MSVKDITKSGTFALTVLALVLVLVPFAVEQFGEATGLFSFPVVKTVKGVFSRKSSVEVKKNLAKVDWDRHLKDIEDFSKWADNLSDVKISIVRPEVFQIVRADKNPATAASFSWKMMLLSEKLEVDATQVKNRLTLICDPEGKVNGDVVSVKPLGGREKGFLVTIGNVRGSGKIGLSYSGSAPVYYDVKLRRIWLVPVAGCRSAMKDRYESAVFFPGVEMGLTEGNVIKPSADKCGYRILSISDHCVWFEAFYGDEPPEDNLPHSIWPDFACVDTLPPTPPPGRLRFGQNRYFWPEDAIKLPNSGSYLMVDDLLGGKAAVFRLLDSSMRPVRELQCVIVREK